MSSVFFRRSRYNVGTVDGRICLPARGYAECVWHVGRCVGELWHIKNSISPSNVLILAVSNMYLHV